MNLRDQRGAVNALLIPFILVILLFFGSAGFGVWAFMSRQDYKNNVDAKIAVAETATKAQTQAADQASYNQQAKYPLKAYVGPAAYGAVTINYPKTWSAYVQDSSSNSSQPVNNYYQPGVVPDTTNSNNTYALRMQVNATPYAQVMAGFASQVQSGDVTVAPYSLPKVKSVVGSIITGQIESNVTGVMIVLPLRDTTLQVWTEQPSEETDFTNIILANMTFAP
ncbi:MAG TPA: hypothetical protein VIM53_03345 [Candidatus Saccharimonadales bacterium]